MLAEAELSSVAPPKEAVLTIGVFDGVHLGHKHLISEVKGIASKQGMLSGVVTFRKHPVEQVEPEASLPYLTSLQEKLKLIKAEGVDFVVALTFDRKLADLTARDFVGLLRNYLRMRALVVGPDFALGRGREGNVDVLRRLGKDIGFSLTVVPPMKIGGEIVSSTGIRQALADGDMGKVVSLTGRPYLIRGKVVRGTGQGRRIGFPTANLEIESGWAIPRDGVYATMTHTNGDVHKSLTSIGMRPTFGGKSRTVETYILDFDGDLYGRDVSIEIIERLREEKKFDNIEDLKKQIARDIDEGISILSSSAH